MSSTPQGTPSISKLDNASKEDLIKLLKRQQLLLKKHNSERSSEKATFGEEINSLKSDLEAQNDAVQQLRTENDLIYSSNQKLTLELEELKDVIKQQDEDISNLEASVKHLSNEKEDHESELSVLKENKEHMKNLLKSLQDSENSLKAQLQSLESQMVKLSEEQENEMLSLNTTITELRHELEGSSSKREGEENSSSLHEELSQTKSDIASLRDEGDSLKNMIKEYNEQFAVETNSLAQVLSSLGASSRDQDSNIEVSELQDQLSSLQQQEATYLETISRLTKENELLKTAPQPNSPEPQESRDEEQTQDEIETQAEIENFRNELAQSQGKVSSLSDQIDTLSRQIKEKEEALENLVSDKEAKTSNEQAAKLSEVTAEYEAYKVEMGAAISERDAAAARLNEDLALAKESLDLMKGEKECLFEKIAGFEKEVEELMSKLESERARIETLEHSAKEFAKILVEKDEEIQRLTADLGEAVESTNRLKEDTQGSHHLLDMELADYQRAADTLQEKLTASKAEVAELEAEMEKMAESLSSAHSDNKELEKQRATLDDMINKLKALLMKAKKDATDAKQNEDDAVKETEETKMTLENTVQNLEDCKLQLADAQGQLSSLREQSKESSDRKSAMLRNLETRLTSVQEELERERDLRVGIGGQFESYKVRVHSVLKQQKTGNESVIELQEHEAVVVQLSKEVEMLKCEVHELRESRDSLTSHRDSLEEEVAALLSNLEKVELESSNREKIHQDRIHELETAVQEKDLQIFTSLQSATAQRAALTDTYTKTLEQANSSHLEATQMLQSRISRLENELLASQACSQALPGPATNINSPADTSTPIRPPKVRLGAEGMESPNPSVSVLEDILNNTNLSRSASRASLSDQGSVTKEDGKISHLSTLLSESEHNAAALQEQCSVLKGEVRRLEKMIGRDSTNTEYLKNIVIKFLSSDSGGREQLVPVLSTVLSLTKEEIGLLTKSASVGKHEQVPWTSTWFYSSS